MTEGRSSLRQPALVITTLVVVALLAWRVNLWSSLEWLGRVDLALFVVACIVAISSRVLRAVKWNILLRLVGISISHFEAIRISTIGLFFGSWTPAQLGSDIYRTIALREKAARQPDVHRPIDSSTVLSTLLVERYANWLSIALIALIGTPWTMHWLVQRSSIGTICLAIVILGTVGIGACVAWKLRGRDRVSDRVQGDSSRLKNMLQMCADSLVRFQSAPSALALFFSLTVIETLGHIVINWLVIQSFGVSVSLGYLFLAMPLVYVLVRLPITIQGIGVQEGAFGLVLINAGLSAELGLAVSFVQRVVEWLTSILPGAAAFCFSRIHFRDTTAKNVEI